MPGSGTQEGRKKWLKDRESSKLSRASLFSKTAGTSANRKERKQKVSANSSAWAEEQEAWKRCSWTLSTEGELAQELRDSDRASENRAVRENSRSLLAPAPCNCSLPSPGCGDANRLTGAPGRG